jgi:HEAT repeat protein
MPGANAADRKKTFKKATDLDDQRKRREDARVTLRTKQRDEMLQKKRMGGGSGMTAEEQSEANIPALLQQISTEDPAAQFNATLQFRKLLSIENNPPIDQVIQSGVVPRLVEFLHRADHPNLQFEAAWALTNIASGTAEHTYVVIQSGAVPVFVQLLSSPAEEVREQAVWALGNIAGDSAKCRDFVLSLNCLEPLLRILQSNPKLSMMRNATWSLSNLCRGKPIPSFNYIQPAMPTLASFLWHTDEEVLADACWAISYISDGPNDRIEAVIQANIVPRLIELLMATQTSVQTPALRTIGNIVTGNDKQTQVIINGGTLPCLGMLLSHPRKGIRKETCWTISNIAAGSTDQVQALIGAGLLPPLINLLGTAEHEVRREAAWAISNATSGGTREQIKYMVENGCIAPICDLLDVPEPKIVNVALEALENILRVGKEEVDAIGGNNVYSLIVQEVGGIDKIEGLQSHQNDEIYDRAVSILETYFDIEEPADANMQEQGVQGGQFNFGGQGQGQQFNFS